MKLLALDLIAYGPFTGARLDLSGGAEGLHLLYGPNEAGKSSTLRALDALLFGMETRTLDAFRHPYEHLRVGGHLRTRAGEELKLIRRKGNKNTLRLDDDTTVVEDAVLDGALGGVTRETFRLMFGIDHEALVQGGRDILEQRGDVGQALFGTALGAAGLHRVLAQLDAEARDLFLSSGSKPRVNQALRGFKEATKQVREHTLKTSQCLEVERQSREAEAHLAGVQNDLAEARTRHNRLVRVKNLLPFAARHGALREALAAAGDPVTLPEDFAARWEAAVAKRRDARKTLDQRQPQLETLGREIAAIHLPQALVDQGETIEGFHQELGGHRKAERDLPDREQQHREALGQARRVLAAVRPDLSLAEVETLRPVLAREAKLHTLATQYSLIAQRAADARDDAQAAALAGDRCRKALAGLPTLGDAGSLRQAVDRAKRGGEIDPDIAQKARGVADRERGLSQRLAALGRWAGSLDDLVAAPLPEDATVDRFEKELGDLDRRLERNRENGETAVDEVARFSRELDAIAAAGMVPTEAELLALRARREAGWALLRGQWIDRADVAGAARGYAPDGDLPGAYERAVGEADEVADRLRREAQRVQQKAAALAGRDAAVRRREELQAERARLEAARNETSAEWVAAWSPCGVDPLGPSEMRGWLTRARQLCGGQEDLASARGELVALRDTCRTLRADLAGALAGLGETAPPGDERLAPLLAHVEARLEWLDSVARHREEGEKGLTAAASQAAEATAALQAADQELEGWQRRWAPLVAELRLPPDAEPGEALAALAQVRQCLGHLDEAAGLAARIQAMTDDLEGFGARLRGFCERAAPDLANLPPTEGVAELNARLTAGREARTRRKELERRRNELAAEVGEAEANLGLAAGELADLTASAGCAGEDEVADRMERHARQQVLGEQLHEVAGRILDLGDGRPLEELLDAAQDIDADVLKADLTQADTEIIELEARQAACFAARTRAQSELDRMDGGGAAAVAALEAQEYLALLGDQVERYTRARLAHRVLKDEIQRYREENEGPLLRRAGEIFGRLSVGSFEALKVDFADETAILVGERSDKGRVPVEGMSSGTRDQLYLALRLAAVERATEKGEPLPFIVDDILVNFDDERSKATLEVLAELARKTQVLVFSHHQGVVELAGEINGGAEVFVHQGWGAGATGR